MLALFNFKDSDHLQTLSAKYNKVVSHVIQARHSKEWRKICKGPFTLKQCGRQKRFRQQIYSKTLSL